MSKQRSKEEYVRLQTKYPYRIPIIISTTGSLKTPDKVKFLCPMSLTFAHFMVVLRKRLESLEPEEAIFAFVKNELVVSSQLLSQIHAEHAADDGFLDIILTKENTFGMYVF